MKKIFTFLLAFSLLVTSFTVPAFAAICYQDGTWVHNEKGWRYEEGGEGQYLYSCECWIDGNHDGLAEFYKFNRDGYCLQNTKKSENQIEWFNENGEKVINGIVQRESVEDPTSYLTTPVQDTAACGTYKGHCDLVVLKPDFILELSQDKVTITYYEMLGSDHDIYDPLGTSQYSIKQIRENQYYLSDWQKVSDSYNVYLPTFDIILTVEGDKLSGLISYNWHEFNHYIYATKQA